MDLNAAKINLTGLTNDEFSKNVVILGSGPEAPSLASLVAPEAIIVAMNNAWQAVPSVDISIYSNDFPQDRRHPNSAKIGRSTGQYIPAMERFGGLMLCGATMALAAGYWAIDNFPCSQISYFASDMIYHGPSTHFYGQGQSDPLRRDVTLQNLAAKQYRLFYFGVVNKVLFLNASASPETRLVFPQIPNHASLRKSGVVPLLEEVDSLAINLAKLADDAVKAEKSLKFAYDRPDYWFFMEDEEVWAALRNVDEIWLGLEPLVTSFSNMVRNRFVAL